MKLEQPILGRPALLAACLAAALLGPPTSRALADTAYVANDLGKSVSVIDTETNKTVGKAIKVGKGPRVLAGTPNGKRVYVANRASNNVSVINTKGIASTRFIRGRGTSSSAGTP